MGGMSQAWNGTGPVLVPLAVMLGAGCAAGVVLLAAGLMRRPETSPSSPKRGSGIGRALVFCRRPPVVGSVCAGVLAGALTGWPVAGALAAAGALTLPGLLGPDRAAERRMERMEAVATWTEMLRDTLAAAAGLEQALLATARVAPPAIRREVGILAEQINGGQALADALQQFADAVDDPAADTVVTVLKTASQQAAQIAPLLEALAEAVREQVAMHQRVAAGRTSARTSVRVCCGTTLLLAVGLVTFNRPYLEPFNGAVGQLALATSGGLFAASFAWLRNIAAIREAPRLLTPHTRSVPAAREAVTRS